MNKPIKTILLGDKECGKTKLREKFLGRGFSANYLLTIGADFALKQVNISCGDFIKTFNVQIWDIASGPAYRRARNLYYRETKGIFAVIDITRQESYSNLMVLLHELKYVLEDTEKIPVVLIGNKADQRKDQPSHITHALGLQMASEISKFINNGKIKTNYIETSTMTGESVLNGFNDLVKTIIKNNF